MTGMIETNKAMPITVLSALPHSLAEVEAAASDPRKDYVCNQLLYFHPPRAAWATVRPYLGKRAERLFRWCAEHGITVVRPAGFDALRTAARCSKTVVVLAHWKGASIRSTDVLAPVTELSDQIAAARSVGILDRDFAPAGDGHEAKVQLAEALTHALDRWSTFIDLGLQQGERAFVSESYGRSLARERIDELFDGRLLPGSRIELADGLWRAADVSNCFPRDWDGTGDFICCTSVYLSDIVKAAHLGAMFRADSRLLDPRIVIPALQEILEAVCCGSEDYISAAYRIDAKYGAEV